MTTQFREFRTPFFTIWPIQEIYLENKKNSLPITFLFCDEI